MKNQLLLFFIGLISCQQPNAQNETVIHRIEYTASSRGSSVLIQIDSSEVKFNNSAKKLEQKDWVQLQNLLSKIDVENLNRLKAPTDERYRDAAATGYLKIYTKKTSYQSSEFDHGNPPEQIAELVEKILALAST